MDIVTLNSDLTYADITCVRVSCSTLLDVITKCSLWRDCNYSQYAWFGGQRIWVVKAGNLDFIKYYMSAHHAIFLAIQHSQYEVLDEMLEENMEFKIANYFILNGHKMLLDKYISLLTPYFSNDEMLALALRNGKTNVVEYFLERGGRITRDLWIDIGYPENEKIFDDLIHRGFNIPPVPENPHVCMGKIVLFGTILILTLVVLIVLLR